MLSTGGTNTIGAILHNPFTSRVESPPLYRKTGSVTSRTCALWIARTFLPSSHVQHVVQVWPINNCCLVAGLGVSPTQPIRLDVPGCTRHLALLVCPFSDRVPSQLEDRVKVSANTPFQSSRRAPHKRGFFVFRGVRR